MAYGSAWTLAAALGGSWMFLSLIDPVLDASRLET